MPKSHFLPLCGQTEWFPSLSRLKIAKKMHFWVSQHGYVLHSTTRGAAWNGITSAYEEWNGITLHMLNEVYTHYSDLYSFKQHASSPRSIYLYLIYLFYRIHFYTSYNVYLFVLFCQMSLCQKVETPGLEGDA